MIEFKSDDYPVSFDMFRMTEAPLSYQDFHSKGTKTLFDLRKGNVPVQTSYALKDAIVPNTKYWYIFRSVDVHGTVSNPSEIFQLEMIDNGTSVYPIIQMYEIPKIEKRVPTKSLRKYMVIKPSETQTQLQDLATAYEFIEGGETLGTTSTDGGTSIWSSTEPDSSTSHPKIGYKVRVTSKKTGKKFDVNVSFKKEAASAKEFLQPPDLVVASGEEEC